MSSYLKAELAATCTTLGRLHKGQYLIEPECIESVKDLIRYLKRDSETHDIRRHLGESKVLQNDLIHIVKTCPEDNRDLFDVTLRLLINLTTPPLLFYGEEIPADKMARNIYLTLTGYGQEYKMAFCDVEFWNKICGKLTGLFETDWTERSADEGIQIERMLMLLRNVVQVPADLEGEKRPENDVSVHDRVLWALRESQVLELLLLVSSNSSEEQYYLNLLEIFSLILREQNPKVLARCDVERSADEKRRDSEELVRARESEKKSRNKYVNTRNFSATFIVKGMKSLSDKDVVCHRSLEKASELEVVSSGRKKVLRARRNRIPVESERAERRSAFSIRLFLKEFCLEFLSTGFAHLMSVVKNRLDSGKSLPNDQTYYFWAVRFFLEFAMASDSDVDLIRDLLSTASFHFVQTSMENALERLAADKKKNVEWIRRIHLILKAYHSLLETLLWMDLSKNPLTRSVSREIKSQIFYVVEYREMTLQLLLRYDPTKFPLSYLRDLIETTHLFVKLLEDYSTQTKMLVQKVTRKRPSARKAKKEQPRPPSGADRWQEIKDDVYDALCTGGPFPELPPFDAALDIPIDDQKGRAMNRIQRFLREGRITEGIGLLRSARQVWPENEYFGAESMSAEEETMALQEICMAELGEVEEDSARGEAVEEEEEQKEERFEDEVRSEVVEQDFDIREYKQRLVHKKVVECCGILLRNYRKNSEHTNHCVIKLLHRIGWECCMPGLLLQASLLWSLLVIMRDRSRCYEEINTFTVNLVRKLRKHASGNPVVFLELLFWKDHSVALEIQHGYRAYEEKEKGGKRPGKKKGKGRKKVEEEGMEEREVEEMVEREMEEMVEREMEEERIEGEGIDEKEREKEEEIMRNERGKGKKRKALFEEETKGVRKKKKKNLMAQRSLEEEEIEKGKEIGEESEEDEEMVISKRKKTKKRNVILCEEEEENKKKKNYKAQWRLEGEEDKEIEEEKEEEIEEEKEKETEKEIGEESEGDEEVVISKRRKREKRKVILYEEEEENKKKTNKAQGSLEQEEIAKEKEIEEEIEEIEEEKEKEIGEESEEDEEMVISKRKKTKKRKVILCEEEEENRKKKNKAQGSLEQEEIAKEKEIEEIEEEKEKEIGEESEEDEEMVISKRKKTKKRKVILCEEEEENRKKKNKAQGSLEKEEIAKEKEIEEIEEEKEKETEKEVGEESEGDEEVVISKRRKREKRKALFYEEDEE